MALDTATPWHAASFDRLLTDRLPQLLAARLPLAGYRTEATGPYSCRIEVTLATHSGEIVLSYDAIPQPDAAGIFEIEGRRLVVLPIAMQDELDSAEIRCVGEQVYAYCEARLGEAPDDLPWDESLARAWLPLDRWIHDAILHVGMDLQQTNWLDFHTLLRRLLIPKRQRVLTPGHFGRVCPFETAEGPNIGRVLTIAVGAEIRDGRLVIADARPEAALGLTASMIPLLEHNEPTRLLMGANMMRQWMRPPDPEPALVQTGNEPDAPDFWCGRNLLTAYVAWGADTFEDALVISESCARRLDYPTPVEPGDKLSNRHGTKGVVSRILPDAEMPHLADGTPVEIVFHFTGLISRLNFGQIRETILSRLARAEGAPALAPPFHTPTESELQERLARANLPADGMETLALGRDGKKLLYPSAVGWVYWGRLYHIVRAKMHADITPDGTSRLAPSGFSTVQDASSGRPTPDISSGPFGQMRSEREYYALHEIGALETIREQFNTQSAERADAATLAARATAEPTEQAGPPTPFFADLVRRLAVAGIHADLNAGRLEFRFAPPPGEQLVLAHSISHPWLRERTLTEVGVFPELAEYAALAEANRRMERMQQTQAPESLRRKALADLEAGAQAFCDALLTPAHLRFQSWTLFSGRTVIAPGADLHLDQVGLAEEITWTLFGPLVARELGNMEAVQARSAQATQALDALMARAWVIISRHPTTSPAVLLAFHPVRLPDRVIRLHPAVCNLLDADFDGDQIAVFLPLTEAGQQEAGKRLSVAGHLARDPALLRSLLVWHEALWGLASLSLSPEGREEIARSLGQQELPEGLLTKASLAEALQRVWEREGIAGCFVALERLLRRGFEVAKESGASLGPFLGADISYPAGPQSDSPDAWIRYAEELQEQIISMTDYSDRALGPLLLAIHSGARGNAKLLSWLVGSPGICTDIHGQPVPIRHNLRDGLTSEEMFAVVVDSREGQARAILEWEQIRQGARSGQGPQGFHVLARAMRAEHPGIVFARAAAAGESDPLLNPDSRLFVGLLASTVH
jgi:hypothetical protein